VHAHAASDEQLVGYVDHMFQPLGITQTPDFRFSKRPFRAASADCVVVQ
jgi:hypothetical protein